VRVPVRGKRLLRENAHATRRRHQGYPKPNCCPTNNTLNPNQVELMEVVKASLHPQPPPSPSSETETESSGYRGTSTDQTQLLRQFDAAQRACVAQQVPSTRIIHSRFPVHSRVGCRRSLVCCAALWPRRTVRWRCEPAQDKHFHPLGPQNPAQNETLNPFQKNSYSSLACHART
jgi:hypothetical protein